jgi:hypothetical protein
LGQANQAVLIVHLPLGLRSLSLKKREDNSLAISLLEPVFEEKREILKKLIVMAFGAKKING